MPYVVTQSCCSDASCVVACPVNCIHPAPGEPGFAEAEMLYVDASSCVDCGACVTACPVDALKPHTMLTDAELPFIEILGLSSQLWPQPTHPIEEAGAAGYFVKGVDMQRLIEHIGGDIEHGPEANGTFAATDH